MGGERFQGVGVENGTEEVLDVGNLLGGNVGEVGALWEPGWHEWLVFLSATEYATLFP